METPITKALATPEMSSTAQALADMGDAFASAFTVATVLVACVLIPAAFLPRKRIEVDSNPEPSAAGHVHTHLH